MWSDSFSGTRSFEVLPNPLMLLVRCEPGGLRNLDVHISVSLILIGGGDVNINVGFLGGMGRLCSASAKAAGSKQL